MRKMKKMMKFSISIFNFLKPISGSKFDFKSSFDTYRIICHKKCHFGQYFVLTSFDHFLKIPVFRVLVSQMWFKFDILESSELLKSLNQLKLTKMTCLLCLDSFKTNSFYNSKIPLFKVSTYQPSKFPKFSGFYDIFLYKRSIVYR